MQRLLEGVHRLQRDQFGHYRALFTKLSRQGQNPETLFITGADSRVLAELIPQSQPGDLFVVKNVGNIVPPATVSGDTNSAAAAIGFAVQVLKGSAIVARGHLPCGVVAALLAGGVDRQALPQLSRWLNLAAPVRRARPRNTPICPVPPNGGAPPRRSTRAAPWRISRPIRAGRPGWRTAPCAGGCD